MKKILSLFLLFGVVSCSQDYETVDDCISDRMSDAHTEQAFANIRASCHKKMKEKIEKKSVKFNIDESEKVLVKGTFLGDKISGNFLSDPQITKNINKGYFSGTVYNGNSDKSITSIIFYLNGVYYKRELKYETQQI